MGKVISICISQERGKLKEAVTEVDINLEGIVGDGHAGNWGRQITLLNYQSYLLVKNKNPELNLRPGSFAENIMIDGLDFSKIVAGTKIQMNDVIVEVSQIGKEDHPSVVTEKYGVSLLPYEGLFCRVVQAGHLKVNDSAKII